MQADHHHQRKHTIGFTILEICLSLTCVVECACRFIQPKNVTRCLFLPTQQIIIILVCLYWKLYIVHIFYSYLNRNISNSLVLHKSIMPRKQTCLYRETLYWYINYIANLLLVESFSWCRCHSAYIPGQNVQQCILTGEGPSPNKYEFLRIDNFLIVALQKSYTSILLKLNRFC